MKAFRIDVQFRTPCIMQDDIYLDTLVSAAFAKKILGDNYYKGKQAGDIDMVTSTLSNYFSRQYGVFVCSKLFLINDKESTTFYTKRFEMSDLHLIKTKTKNIDTGRGYAKNYHNHLQYKVADRGIFYAVGNMESIKHLLINNITNIGKKSSQGYGEVLSWSFKEIAKFEWIRDNKLVRNIPAEIFEKSKELCKANVDVAYAYKSIVPPYWRNEKIICAY